METTATQARELRSTGALVAWTIAWLVTLAAAQFGPELWWGDAAVASWIAVGANLIAGIGWIVAFTVYLRSLDDLQRKITQDALAAAFGVGWVLGFAYVVAHSAGLVPELSLALLPALMGVVFLVGIVVGRVRYR